MATVVLTIIVLGYSLLQEKFNKKLQEKFDSQETACPSPKDPVVKSLSEVGHYWTMCACDPLVVDHVMSHYIVAAC